MLIVGIFQDLLDTHHVLEKLCKELDPTRLTTISHVSHTPVDGPMHHITDLESYNHYFGWYGGKMEQNGPWLDKFHADHPDICIGVSEYGCEGIINWHSNTPECKDYTEEYQALYHEHMAQVFEDRPWVWASHVWNMFDFGCAARHEGGVSGRNNKGRGEQGRPAGQNGQTPQESGGETRQPREGQPGRPDRQPRRNDRPRNGGNGGERQNGGNGSNGERLHNGRGDNNRGENNSREPRENNGREPRENNGGGREGGNRSRNNRNRRRGNGNGNGNNGGNAPAGNNGNGGGSEGGNNGGTHQNQ